MNEKEIIQILQEEKVRSLIEKENKKGGVVFLEFLNSALGIWFLSTIVIGLITFGYTSVQSSFEQKLIEERLKEKLDLEIEGRLYQFKFKAQREIDSLEYNEIPTNEAEVKNTQALSIKDYWFQLKQSPALSNAGYYSVYPEFENRNFVSLLFELNTIVQTEDEQSELRKIIRKTISDEVLPIQNSSVDRESIDEILLQLKSDRWRNIWSE